jgi:hypothetical protein
MVLSPEERALATLGRTDSKCPDRTCCGITAEGKPCRRLKRGREKYCYLHLDQQQVPRAVQSLSTSRVGAPPPPSSTRSTSGPREPKTNGLCKLGRAFRRILCLGPHEPKSVDKESRRSARHQCIESAPIVIRAPHMTIRSGPSRPIKLAHASKSTRNLPVSAAVLSSPSAMHRTPNGFKVWLPKMTVEGCDKILSCMWEPLSRHDEPGYIYVYKIRGTEIPEPIYMTCRP